MTNAVMTAEFGEPGGPRDRFQELTQSPYYDLVVAANRLYLAAAVADPLGTERSRWALACLPGTNRSDRFSTVSMGDVETFVLRKPRPGEDPEAFVIVSEVVLDSFGPLFDVGCLEIFPAGEGDEVGVVGNWREVIRALSEEPLRVAARAMAERLMVEKTPYAQYHDHDLANRVLGRF
jgi:hypothetical protein